MTISTEPAPLSYSGDGTTDTFPITWKYFDKSHVVATLRDSSGSETTWVLNTDYTLTAAGVEAGGTLTATTAPASGETLVITLEPPNTQDKSLPLGGPFQSTAVEAGLDVAAQRDAAIEALFNRSLRVPKTDTQSGSELEIPIDTTRANKYLAFDANGSPIASTGTGTDTGLRGDLASTSNASLGDALIGGKRTDTGAVAFTLHTFHQNRIINAKTDFGAVGDNSTDDTSALQAAIDAVEALGQGGSLYIPQGRYKITAALTITVRMTIFGDGPLRTRIVNHSATAHTFTVTCNEAVNFASLSIEAGVTKTNGACISLDGISGGVNTRSLITDFRFASHYYGLLTQAAAGFCLRDGYLVNLIQGVTVQNTVNTDQGDSRIESCTFDTSDSTSTNYAIRQFSSGGLRIKNNKILNHYRGVSLEVDDTASTSILIIEGNSFEWQRSAAIYTTINTGGSFGKVVIVGNQFSYDPASAGSMIQNNSDIRDWVISGNQIAVSGSTSYAILFNDGDRIVITGNSLIDHAGTANGVGFNAAVTYATVSDNTFVSFNNDVVSNNATNVHGNNVKKDATLTLTGVSDATAPTGTARYTRSGNLVTLYIPGISGTSNSTDATLTGLPAEITPGVTQLLPARTIDNGITSMAPIQIDTGGVITLFKDASSAVFASSGTKGIATTTVTYRMD